MDTNAIIPVLRIFDEDKAKEFYAEFLGFEVDWEHRYEDDFPVYMQISKGRWRIHLSEHNGDCSPGAALRLNMTGIDAYQQALHDKQYKYARPGPPSPGHGGKEMPISDPFGNKLIFCEPDA